MEVEVEETGVSIPSCPNHVIFFVPKLNQNKLDLGCQDKTHGARALKGRFSVSALVHLYKMQVVHDKLPVSDNLDLR